MANFKQMISFRLRRLHRDESGAAYTLSYVMVVPIIMLLVCLAVETTLFMTAKVGTVYAAYAAGRTAAVWSSSADWSTVRDRARWAAQRAFVPFASGMSFGDATEIGSTGERYQEAYASYVDDPVGEAYLNRKLHDAKSHVDIDLPTAPTTWDEDLEVTVTYDFPFRVPGIGRLLGERSADGTYRLTLSSRAVVQNEAPQNNAQRLGVGYASRP